MAGDDSIGTIIGGIAVAVGGWWAGRAVVGIASTFSDEDDKFYRLRYELSGRRLADRSYEHVRSAYQLGHLARRNPDYRWRDFDSIEPELRAGWTESVASRHGSWEQVRDFARAGYTYDAPARVSPRDDTRPDAGDEARLQVPRSRR